MKTGVDPWPRIEFYVRNGLVKTMPNSEQLRKASAQNAYEAGPIERFKYYIRHPLDLFPTDVKKQKLARSKFKAVSETTESNKSQVTGSPNIHKDRAGVTRGSGTTPVTDRILTYTFQFSPTRLAVQCYFNPWTLSPGTGLNVPLKNLIEHVVHAPAPSSLWDAQIIHPDPGGLDQLERAIDLAATGRDMKSRTYRALVQDLDYYDYLRDLVVRVRHFDYPPPPPGYNPIFENLVTFLNYAITL